jgi:hypothetical protein
LIRLQKFDISECSKLKELPNFIGKMTTYWKFKFFYASSYKAFLHKLNALQTHCFQNRL